MSSPPQILIVEDDCIIAADIDATLRSYGYGVIGPFNTGEKALASVAELAPDLLLMDIFLGGNLDGIQTAEQINQTLDIPVIYLTAHSDDAVLERAKITEPYAYVIKPHNEIELKIAIDMSLFKHTRALRRYPEREPVDLCSDSAALGIEQKQILDILAMVPHFSAAQKALLNTISAGCRISEVKAGTLMALEGDIGVAGFVVVDGRVAALKTSTSGKELIVDLVLPGDSLGLSACIDQSPYPFSIQALIDSRILWVSQIHLQHFLDQQPEVFDELVGSLFARLRNAHDFSRQLAHDLVGVRVASMLLALVPRLSLDGNDKAHHSLKISRQELASLTGTSPETVSRALAPLEKSGIIDLSEHGLVTLLDIPKIQKLVAQ